MNANYDEMLHEYSNLNEALCNDCPLGLTLPTITAMNVHVGHKILIRNFQTRKLMHRWLKKYYHLSRLVRINEITSLLLISSGSKRSTWVGRRERYTWQRGKGSLCQKTKQSCKASILDLCREPKYVGSSESLVYAHVHSITWTSLPSHQIRCYSTKIWSLYSLKRGHFKKITQLLFCYWYS